jgi:hypothetical protein
LKRGKLKHPKNTEYRHYYEPVLPPESQLFQVWFSSRYYNSEGEIFLFLDELQLDLFRYYLPIPDNCNLYLKDSYKPELFVSRNTEILTQLQILRVYIHQVGVKRAKNGIKILKASIKDVRSLCSIEELYPEVKGLENLRLVMLLELVEKFLKKKKNVSKLSSEEFIKSIFAFYFNPKESELFNLCQFLDYLKFSYIGKNSADPERYYQERVAVQNLLSQLELGKWVEISNIHRYFNGQGIMPQPFDLSGNIGEIYFNTKSEISYGSYTDRNIICAANKGEALYLPYIKVLVFVLNTLGVLDISYTMPVNNTFQDKSNPWLSVYDGIQEVSLTSLGAWLLGRTEVYEGIKKEPSAKVILDNKRLIVTVEGKDPVVDLTLTRLSRPLGSGSYIVSPDIFLQDCESLKDIKRKIISFRTNICKNPPQVWEDFFTSLLSKVNPLKYKKEEMLLFQLDPVNRDLISLLFSDPHLKWNIMKVEDYQILIKKSSYKAVKKRLAEHGYLLLNEYSSIKI